MWIILTKSQEKQQLEEPDQLTPQILELPGKKIKTTFNKYKERKA